MRIVGYHIEDGIIANSDGEYCIEQPFADFLLMPKPESIKVFYHMGHAVANLLKMMNIWEEEGKKLQANGELLTEPYLIKHRAGKFLSIKKGHYWGSPFANFSDMSQYTSAEFEDKKDVEYCFEKARFAQSVGAEVYAAMLSIGLTPNSLTSPINAYYKQVLSKANLPTIDDMPEEVGYYAYQCCQGSWLEAFQLGHWDVAYDYDINSAYPYELYQLLDIREGEWAKAEGSAWIPEAEYAFCKGIVHNRAGVSPVIFSKEENEENKDNLNYTPTGRWERFLSKKKIEFIRERMNCEFEMADGWFWIPKKRATVLEPLIAQLWHQKQDSEGIAREVIKRTMSGIWGMFLQATEEGFGDMFNPVYGAEVESNVRVRVAKFIDSNQLAPIHVSLDGVLSTNKPRLMSYQKKQRNGNIALGEWELASEAPAICAGTAAVAIKGREKTADFSVDYNWLIEMIEKCPDLSSYSMTKLSPVSLAVALNGDWDKLGELREITKTIYIGDEQKRYYKEQPKVGSDLITNVYESEPWDVSILNSTIQKQKQI